MQIQIDEANERKDKLEEKGLDGEVKDIFVDYKEEVLKTFEDIMDGKMDINGVERSNFSRLVDKVGKKAIDNTLGVFSLEYAECRGNLNKEQAFYYLALYQYSVSRQYLLQTYLKATTEKHPDILRLRHLETLTKDFALYSTPFFPKQHSKVDEELKEHSKPYKILSSFFSLEEFKEHLPNSSAYLVIQLSEDK